MQVDSFADKSIVNVCYVTFESQSETDCEISCTNTTLLTVDGASELIFAFTVNPAVEKILSDGALVAGMARIARATFDNLRNV